MRSRITRVGASALAVLLTATIAGCGGDDDSSEPASSQASAPKSNVAKPTGKPIVLYSIGDTTGAGSVSAVIEQFPVGEEAAVEYINNELGGVDGRPFKLVRCDSKADPAATTACANEAIKNDAVAKVGLSVLWDNGNKIFARAGVPSLNAPVTNSDSVSPTSFPLAGGSTSEFPAQVEFFATKKGVKHIVMLADDNPQGQVQVGIVRKEADRYGVKLDVVPLKIGADPTPSVARVVGFKPDLVITAAAGSAAVAVYRAFQQQGFPADKIVNTGAVVDHEAFFSKIDAAAIEGTHFSYVWDSYDDEQNEDVATFRKAMKDYSDVDGRSGFYQWGFSNVMTVYAIAKQVGGDGFGAAELLDFLKGVDGFPVFMGSELSVKSAPKDAPQIIQPNVQIVRYEDGKVVPESDGFINPFAEQGK